MGSVGPAAVWRLDLDLGETALASAWTVLSAGERERADRMARPESRRRFVAARAGLRWILADHVGTDPRALVLAIGAHGKPSVPGGPLFSLSHSEGLALCAVTGDREVGLDVEWVRPIPEADAILDRWFGEPERRAWRASGGCARGFMRLWTRREAYLKALGIGFSDETIPRDIDLARWEVHDLEPGDGYLGALILERPFAEVARRAEG
jgi:4'-phosphopantetheinyl transferase